MQALLKRVVDGIREDFGQPVSLCRMLAAHPQTRTALEAPAPCIHASSVPRWHELGMYPPLGGPRRSAAFCWAGTPLVGDGRASTSSAPNTRRSPTPRSSRVGAAT